MNFAWWISYTLFQFLVLGLCTSLDTISITQPIRDGYVLVSNGETFALGFISPGKSNYRYVGIWYHKVPEKTIVWVANRDNPINDTSGFLSIDTHGNLVVFSVTNDQTVPLWSTNASASPTDNSVAQLLDSSNLVLFQNDSKRLLWQSFDYPTNTMLPKMKLGLDRRTGLNRFLTSWKSQDDPGTGNYTFMINPSGFPQMILYKDFGIKMFGDDQIKANTNRVVGTYSYVSPEYAMNGVYSTKSDVFSFSILLLEIISGRKNTNFIDGNMILTLIGHVWELWKEGRAMDIVDTTLVCQPISEEEVSRCIQIGLLCLQEGAIERPSMSSVVFMLANEMSLPPPTRPAFILQENFFEADSSLSRSEEAVSLNRFTITRLEAR